MQTEIYGDFNGSRWRVNNAGLKKSAFSTIFYGKMDLEVEEWAIFVV